MTWQEKIAQNEEIIRRLEADENKMRRHLPPVRERSALGHVAAVGNSMRQRILEVTVDISSGLVMTAADLKDREL